MSEGTAVDQAVVLCGGLGSRLGSLAAAVPKPLLPVAGRPFLERLLFEIKRHGLHRILLLAAHMSAVVAAFAREASQRLDIEIEVALEPGRAGTGGALWHARDRLDPRFFLFNGDSWFDFNILDLAAAEPRAPSAIVAMALRRISDPSRYGTVEMRDGRVTSFSAQGSRTGPAFVNGGVYVVDRRILALLTPDCSLEQNILQPLAASGQVAGRVYDGYFIDIGVPSDYERAQTEIPARQRRGAIFLDRDGVLNADHGYVGEIERFDWLPGAMAAIKSVNDSGMFVFVVTNQAGVARGLYSEEDVRRVHEHMSRSLAGVGAHVDDFRYCPFHPQGSVPAYTRASDRRKPAPGMLLELMACWPVDRTQSIVIGDQESDVEAGNAAGLPSYLIRKGEDLGALLAQCIASRRETTKTLLLSDPTSMRLDTTAK
jgi:D-glycero-D-manno-heptose 1,7-bisphosphate phosphatase